MKHNDITVLILLYKTPKNLISNILAYKDFKILILDQSNDKKTKKFLQNKLPKINYYGLTNKNKGFAKAQNFLIKKVKTKYFFSTQPDIKINKDSIYRLKKLLKKSKKNLISIPNINNSISKKNKSKITSKKMIGAAFLSKKKEFIKFGMFDENFFFYWEDVDLSTRIDRSAFVIVKDYYSRATHLSGNSTDKGIYQTYILNLIILRFNKSLLNIFNLIGILKFLILKKK